jgi:hypothetical protein
MIKINGVEHEYHDKQISTARIALLAGLDPSKAEVVSWDGSVSDSEAELFRCGDGSQFTVAQK